MPRRLLLFNLKGLVAKQAVALLSVPEWGGVGSEYSSDLASLAGVLLARHAILLSQRLHALEANSDKKKMMFRALVLLLGDVYMTPGRLSRRGEFTPVPSHGSTFVYMIPPQNVMPARVCPGVSSLQCEISQRCHVNAKRPPVPVGKAFRSAGRLERVAHA